MVDSRVADLWVDLIPEDERAVFESSGHGGPMAMGDNIALVVVDATHHFLGDRPEPIMESIRRWPFSCGEVGWEGVAHAARLLEAARASELPIAFTTGFSPGDGVGPGRWVDKSRVVFDPDLAAFGHQIVDPLKPADGEVVIRKEKPSAFFGTALLSWIVDQRIDSLVVCGGTTSGCVRATVIDAFSYNIRCAVVADATFDRSSVSHRVNLFDLHQKYAEVMMTDTAIDLLTR